MFGVYVTWWLRLLGALTMPWDGFTEMANLTGSLLGEVAVRAEAVARVAVALGAFLILARRWRLEFTT